MNKSSSSGTEKTASLLFHLSFYADQRLSVQLFVTDSFSSPIVVYARDNIIDEGKFNLDKMTRRKKLGDLRKLSS